MVITQSELFIAGIAAACIGVIYRNANARLDRLEKNIDYILKHLKNNCDRCS